MLLTICGCIIQEHPGFAGSGGGGTTTAGDASSGTSATGETTTSGTGDGSGTTAGTTDTGSVDTGNPPPGSLIFVSSSVSTGDLGGLAGADALCGGLAADAGLTGDWIAVLSTPELDAATRVQFDAPLHNIHGDLVAMDSAQLWSATLDAAVGFDETGLAVVGEAWTGSEADGTVHAETCAGFTAAGQSKGRRGDTQGTNSDWISVGWRGCQESLRVYCIRL